MSTAIVTGAASGIGAACADVLIREGWQVVGLDLDVSTNRAGADPRPDDSVGSRHSLRHLDVTDESAWDELMAELGPVEGLVTSAGIRTRGMIVDTSLADWERHVRINLTGTWLAIRAFLRAREDVAEPAGAIVTISSVNASLAVPGQAHYVASKGGIDALTRAAALEGAPRGVRVNGVAPGPIRTPMAAERLSDPDQVRWLTGRVPLGRVGEAVEVAEVVAFLLSSRASYVSGEIVYVDGGWAANAV